MEQFQNVPESSGEGGNTKTPSPTINPAKNWCFTLNNYTEEEFCSIKSKFKELNAKWIIGKEIGEENNTPHLQGYVSFKTKTRWSSLHLTNRIHWEKCKGTKDDNVTYCSKEGNFESNFHKPINLIKKLYPWQEEMERLLKETPDDRTVYWLWEETGNVGKTSFAKYLSYHYEAIPLEGKKNDILYCAAEFESNIYIYDLERSMEEFVSYASIEKIKNGYYMCSKYESRPIIRNSPHVVIIANFQPDESKLSLDRWKIGEITRDKMIEWR